jgi:predicted enzyme related to lactoylglutathione lyase
MANPFVHVELHTQDPQAAKKFYGELFAVLKPLPLVVDREGCLTG